MTILRLNHRMRFYRDILAAYLAVRFPECRIEAGETILAPQILIGDEAIMIDESIGARETVARIDQALRAEGAPGTTSLTRREREVLGCLAEGGSNRDIAAALGLQVATVKLHVCRICRKLGVGNRTQAALMARQNLMP